MKITCTIDEMKELIEVCYGNRVFMPDACRSCVMARFCKDTGYQGLTADFEIIKEECAE